VVFGGETGGQHRQMPLAAEYHGRVEQRAACRSPQTGKAVIADAYHGQPCRHESFLIRDLELIGCGAPIKAAASLCCSKKGIIP
jgi:hypothetical protein